MDDIYKPKFESSILWNDPTINIKWLLEEFDKKSPILSAKDKKLPKFSEIDREYNNKI